jgi:CheY-like chemotaxis protein
MKNILVLEDDPANLQIFAAPLWSKGYNVLEAGTAREALDAAQRTQKLDLFVSDVGLKWDDLSGTLTKKYGALPIVFVTGTPLDSWDERDRKNLRLLSPTCAEVLEKPFLPRLFEATVARMLRLTDNNGTSKRLLSDQQIAMGRC